jgi:hypothetical protein
VEIEAIEEKADGTTMLELSARSVVDLITHHPIVMIDMRSIAARFPTRDPTGFRQTLVEAHLQFMSQVLKLQIVMLGTWTAVPVTT